MKTPEEYNHTDIVDEMSVVVKNDPTEANSLLRSAYQIALREGKETNWEAFKGRVYEELVREHNEEEK